MKRSLPAIDRNYVWHPFTQHSEWERDLSRIDLVISKGRGAYLYDSKGRKYLDGISSLWANIHGHNHPALNAAVTKQLKRIAHCTFLGLTHEPGIRLAQELVKLTPRGLTRVFYSDNGATSVEVALKMAYQYHAQGSGEARPEFLALENSYHGDTLGSVSVGGIGIFHRKFKPLLFKAHFAMAPACLRCPHNRAKTSPTTAATDGDWAEPHIYKYRGEDPKPGDLNRSTGCRWECLGSAEKILKARGKKIAAAIAEPIVQGAAGIHVASPGYLRGLARLCKKYGTLLILDEVAVGFGRTGKMFTSEHEGVAPDLMCLAKGISGGYLPLAATLASEKIYRAFLGRYDEFKTFFHGHTYTANPLACAAGLASLEIFRKDQTLRHVQKLSKILTRRLKAVARLPRVGHVRQAGLMAGIELVENKGNLRPFPPSARMGKKVCEAARKYGLLLRPLGDTIVVLPPLTIREKELNFLMDGLVRAIGDVPNP